MQSVQRAEIWGVIRVLQAAVAVHVGVDNFIVVRHVPRLVEATSPCQLFALVNDGDLLLLVKGMLEKKGPGLPEVSKVEMVSSGQVRALDKVGNYHSDDAADYGRRRVAEGVIDARRRNSGVCNICHPVVGMCTVFHCFCKGCSECR